MSEGRVLLAKRAADDDYYPGVWDVLGGHVKMGESVQEALFREVREESGTAIVSFELVEVMEEPNPQEYGPGQFHIFAVTSWEGPEPRPINHEHERFQWFTLAEALTLPLPHSSYERMLAKLLPYLPS